MSWPSRITAPLLDVLELLLASDGEVHGWEVARRIDRSGPTVYQVFERLRTAGWLEYRWEEPPADENRPRRRYCWLTAAGREAATMVLIERRGSGSDC